MNRLRYYVNNKCDKNSYNSYFSNDYYTNDYFYKRKLYQNELFSTNFYPTYMNTIYSEPRSYRPGGCCTPEIFYKENVTKRSLVYEPYIKKCAKPLFYTPKPRNVFFNNSKNKID